MSPVWAIVKKDIQSLLTSPMFYMLVGFCSLLWATFFSFQVYAFVQQSYQASTQVYNGGLNIHYHLISSYVVVVHYLLVFIIAALSLRFFAEEKKTKTFPILLTSPMTSWQIVLAKWLVGSIFISLLLLVSAIFPLSLLFFISLPIKLLVLSYFGLLLILSVYMSAAMLASALSESLIVCVVLSLVLSISLLLLGVGRELSDTPVLQDFFGFLTIDRHFSLFRNGVVSLSSIFYFLSGSFLFGLLTERVVEFHRWR